MPSQDVCKFTPVSYRTLALWGCCPTLTTLLQLITPSRASGTTDHVQSLDDLFITAPAHPHATLVAMYPALFRFQRPPIPKSGLPDPKSGLQDPKDDALLPIKNQLSFFHVV